MNTTTETNDQGEAVLVTTLPGGQVLRELDRRALPPAPEPRHITNKAFRFRFTREEKAAIEWVAVDKATDPTQARQMSAALRADLKDQESASFIDLDDPATLAGLQGLEAFAIIAAGRAAEIAGAPVQPEERPV